MENHKYPEEEIEIFAEEERLLAILPVFYVLWEPEEGLEIFAEEERLLAIVPVFYVLWKPEPEEGIEMEGLEIFEERLLATASALQPES